MHHEHYSGRHCLEVDSSMQNLGNLRNSSSGAYVCINNRFWYPNRCMVPQLHNEIDAWVTMRVQATLTESGCLYKHKHTSWNFGGFLCFCMQLERCQILPCINNDFVFHIPVFISFQVILTISRIPESRKSGRMVSAVLVFNTSSPMQID